jgi:hypothetical protein
MPRIQTPRFHIDLTLVAFFDPIAAQLIQLTQPLFVSRHRGRLSHDTYPIESLCGQRTIGKGQRR